ncbi:uncharacterized protein MKZ38_008351 [Zalerion maritima]|uniref:DUF7580 domain-containing protein n=1 Tax=Zalerion maritima TaxID=339359 RepID=A0AAD5WTX5_9PEZI|nr:uncharacterized protein MKZ38_008351 [Zalerion maritima]
MDIFGTTITVLTEIYNITIFIQGVVSDIKAYDSTKLEIQDKLDHEILFLCCFRDLFFDKEAVMCNDHLHVHLKRDVHIILMALRKALTEYRMLAAKHELLDAEINNSELLSFSERVKLKVKDLKRTVDWALFDKERILKTLAEYSEWTGRLRQTMSLVLLTLAAFRSSALGDSTKSKRAKDMGLQDVVARQALVNSKPPEDFHGLSGHIVEVSELVHGSRDMRLAKYEDDWCRVEEVVLEYRKYSSELVRAAHFRLPELDKLKEPIRSLAWLLHTASFTDARDDDLAATPNQLAIYTLRCLGFIDQPEQHQTIFLYQLPRQRPLQRTSRIATLHDWINNVDPHAQQAMSKPSLGNRFSLAHALCLTLLNIHGSGWIHKNIWSRGIVIFPSTRPLPHSTVPRFVPYLTGWGFSRPIAGGTDLAADTEVEPNYYRHPIRQGYPEAPFKVEHDIYALGVVLLEIGLWGTVSCIFKKQMDKAAIERRLPPPNMIREALVEKARTRLASDMGDSYAMSVERCLRCDFGVDDDDENRAMLLSAAFRETVMDTMVGGMKL